MKSKALKLVIIGGVIFSIFYAKHLVTLDAIENVDVSYTKDSGTPGEVLMYKDGVSFGQESERDIPLYISQQTLETVPEDLVIEVADPEEKTLTPPPTLKSDKTKDDKVDNPFLPNDKKKDDTKKETNSGSSTKTDKKEPSKPKEESKKETTKPAPAVTTQTEQKESKPTTPAKPVETPKQEESVVVAPPVVPEVPVVPEAPAPVVTPTIEESKPEITNSKFSDIVFIGDSIMEGLSLYTINHNTALKDATFIYKNGVSSYNLLNGTVSYNGVEQNLVDALISTGKKNFCISLGTNDLVSFNVEQSVDNLFKLCDNIKAKIPDANITIISTTYVAEGKVKENLSTSNVLMYNYKVKKNAERYNYGYINWAHLLNDDYGNLASKYTTDSFVHLNEDAYKIYTDTLINY